MNERCDDNRNSYITIDHFSQIRFEERKSVFYGWAAPITSEQQALDLIDKAKKKYPDARHHVYAWICGGNVLRSKYSDDGEPSGTAGIPVLDALRKNHIENAIIIIIRYFGGILLGGGGLVRAYSASAMLALRDAGIVKMQKYSNYIINCTYSDFERIKRSVTDNEFLITMLEYSDNVKATISCPVNKTDILEKYISDNSNGKAAFGFIDESYQKAETISIIVDK